MKNEPNPIPSKDFLDECFAYDPLTGIMRWKKRPRIHFDSNQAYKMWNTRYAGMVCDTRRGNYLGVSINGVSYYIHRLIWMIMTNDQPPRSIDHKDGDKYNNQWDNIRNGDSGVNGKNAAIRSDNTSGMAGVRKRLNGNWYVMVGTPPDRVYLGDYDNLEEAKRVCREYRKISGFSERHGE